MKARLRDARGWHEAITKAEGLFGHAYSSHHFAVVGDIVLPELPAGVSSGLVLNALMLISNASHERAPEPRRVMVEPAHPHDGEPTNVIDCWFDQPNNRYLNGGVLRARVMGASSVRSRIQNAYRHMVSNIDVANHNDPELTESPRFHTKVQSAWVRSAAERRGAGQ
jgi:hypothetical protein